MLLCLPGKHEYTHTRNEAFLEDNNAVMIERDYAEALMAEFDMEIQSEAFGFNYTLSIEDSTCEYHNKYHNNEINQGKVNMDFHSHFQMNLLIIQLLHLSI